MVAITFPTSAAPRPAPAVQPARRPGRLHAVPPLERAGAGAGRLLGALVLVAVLVAAVGYLLAQPALDPTGAIAVQDQARVVTTGETMWSIATEVAPAGEAATYVERLVAVNGSATVTPGQVLELPVP
ncbi:MAG: LysM peptidoglycan-binding domain-containing protein [Acidimicrobiales bacterium]